MHATQAADLEAYMWIISYQIKSFKTFALVSDESYRYKLLLAILSTIDFLAYCTVGMTLDEIFLNSQAAMKLPMTYQAICEWTGVALILTFNGSFVKDFNSKLFVSTDYDAAMRLGYISGITETDDEFSARPSLVGPL